MAKGFGLRMLHRLNVLSSIRGKITFMLCALTFAAGYAGYTTYVALDEVSQKVGGMTNENLPQLSQSIGLMTSANTLKDAAIMIMLSGDQDALATASEDVQAGLADIEKTVGTLAPQMQKRFSQDLEEARRALNAAITARQTAFENTDQLGTMIRELRTVADGFRGVLLELSDNAQFEIVIHGEETIASIEGTLIDLVEQKFAVLQSILQIRSEINLMSGTALAIATANDPAMRSILADLSVSSQGRLADVLMELDSESVDPELRGEIEAVAGILKEAATAGQARRRVDAAAVLSARQTADALLSSAVDDMVFDLTIAADDAATGNRASIERLLNNEVAFIGQLLEINSRLGDFQVEALKIATGQSVEQVEIAERALINAASAMDEFRTFGNGELGPIINGLAKMTTPDVGLASFRINSIRADQAAAASAREAAQAVLEIAKHASTQGIASQDAISARAFEIDAAATMVKSRLEDTRWIAAGLFVITLVLNHLLIVRPLHAISFTTRRLADGNLRPVTGFDRASDEIARISNALTIFRDGLVEKAELAEATEKERAETQRRQSEAVEAIGAGLARLADGDLAYRIDADLDAGFAQLKTDFNSAAETLNLTVVDVINVAESIRSSATDISQASDKLSQRTENQAATLKETAATLEELVASVRSAAEGSRDAATTTHDAKKQASESAEIVQSAVKAMEDIEKSSAQIAQIIGVIDDIAFQTNLLALNAGVEAARAGDAGRGFAVVASEVRGLSQRTTDAAHEIKGLITKSSDQVEMGVNQVGRTGSALENIIERVNHISVLVSGIADATSEQAIGLGESSRSISELDVVTQKNASMVGDTSSAGQTLRQDAETLVAQMSKFSVVAPAIASHDADDFTALPLHAAEASAQGWQDGAAGAPEWIAADTEADAWPDEDDQTQLREVS